MCRTRRTSSSSIIDANKVVGDIPDTPGVHGIAIAPELNRGFVSNGRGSNVTIFDLKTLKSIGTAATGENPIRSATTPYRGGLRVQRPIEELDRDRREDGHRRWDDSAGWQAGVLGGGWQRQGLRQHRGHQRNCRD